MRRETVVIEYGVTHAARLSDVGRRAGADAGDYVGCYFVPLPAIGISRPRARACAVFGM
jgi:hypothetical protein